MKKHKRRKPLGEVVDERQVVVVRQPRRNLSAGLLKNQADDSVLASTLKWGIAIGVAYYGGRYLVGSISKTRTETVLAREEDRAATTTGTASALAGRLKQALSDWGNSDEQVVWDIFEGRQITTREYLLEVATSYKIQTKGRVLIDDLYNLLDSAYEIWKPDWNRLKPTLDKIMRTTRVVKKK